MFAENIYVERQGRKWKYLDLISRAKQKRKKRQGIIWNGYFLAVKRAGTGSAGTDKKITGKRRNGLVIMLCPYQGPDDWDRAFF